MGDFTAIARNAPSTTTSLRRKVSPSSFAEGFIGQFTEFYYNTFDQDPKNLAALYRDTSMLTFETSAIQGVTGIIDKLTTLPFQKVVHKVATLDAQPSNESGGILVMVTGALLVDEEQRPMNYTQVFQLLSDGSGSYYVFNDVFRLVYG